MAIVLQLLRVKGDTARMLEQKKEAQIIQGK